MPLVRVTSHGEPRMGVVAEDGQVAISRTWSRLEECFGPGFTEAIRSAMAATVSDPLEVVGLDGLRPLPILNPPAIRDFLTFEEHLLPIVRRQGQQRLTDVWYEQPIGYFSNPGTVLGPYDDVAIPGDCSELDFELEVAAVVGQTASSVPVNAAAAHLAGFTIFCDWSARDLQVKEMTGLLGPFKGKDFANTLGSVFVPIDELEPYRTPNGYELQMSSSVNDVHYGSGSWSEASWSFEELLSYASWSGTVQAGELLGSGTCRGGCIGELSARHSSEQFPWLQAGDRVHLTVERLGEVNARVVEPRVGAWPGLRPRPGASEQ